MQYKTSPTTNAENRHLLSVLFTHALKMCKVFWVYKGFKRPFPRKEWLFHMKILCEKKKKRLTQSSGAFCFLFTAGKVGGASLWGPTLEESRPDCGVTGQNGSRRMLSAVFPQNWHGLCPWSCCVTLFCFILCHAALGAAASLRLLFSPAPQSQSRHQAQHD